MKLENRDPMPGQKRLSEGGRMKERRDGGSGVLLVCLGVATARSSSAATLTDQAPGGFSQFSVRGRL